MQAFVLSLREGLEAALIVSILLGTLRRLGRNDLGRYIWLGIAVAVVSSVILAFALNAAGVEFEGGLEAVFEGLTVLLAAVVLTWMVFWMQRQGAQLVARLTAEVTQAARTISQSRAVPYGGLSLFLLAFLAVFREGVELSLLLAATALASSPTSVAMGAGLGLATAVALGILLFVGVVRLNLKRFFQVGNGLLVVFAAGMVGLGVHEMIEAGVIPAIMDPVWNINPILNEKSGVGQMLKALLGYNGNPALTEVVAYVGYLVIIGWAIWLRRRPKPATQWV